MINKRRLIALMLTSTIGVGITTMAGCRSGAEKNCEEKIRQLLEYDANIDIGRNYVETYGIFVSYEISDAEYLITFKTKNDQGRGLVIRDKITYSVDKDFFYDFKNSYSEVEGQNEVDLVTSLTSTYDPIKILVNGEERTL